MLRLFQVAWDKDGFPSGFLYKALGLVGIVVLIEIGDQNVSAFSGKGDCDRAADAAIAAGNNGFLAVEAIAALVRPWSGRGFISWVVPGIRCC
jgi:hypothetical protein